MTGHTKVLQQQVAGEDVGIGQVPDGLAVLDDGLLRILGRGVAQVQVEWRHAPLDVAVIDDQVVAILVDGGGGLGLEFGEQRLAETRLWQPHAAVFLGVDQPAGTVMLEDEVVLLQDVRARRRLDGREPVADQLEDHVVGGQQENDHDETAFAGGVDELVVAVGKMPDEFPVAFGLALLGPAEHRKNLADRLPRHQVLEEEGRLDHPLQVDVEVGAGKPEQDRHVVLGHEHRVDEDSGLAVLERYDERHGPVAADDPANQIGAADLVEDGSDQLDAQHGAAFTDAFSMAVYRARYLAHAAIEVTPGRLVRYRGQQFLEQQLERAAIGVAQALDRRGHPGERVEIQRDKLDFRGDAHRAEEAARQGVEESLAELRVGHHGDACRKPLLDGDPELATERVIAEFQAQRRHFRIDVLGVQLDSLDSIALAAVPVAGIEPTRCPARHRAEFGVITLESLGGVFSTFVAEGRQSRVQAHARLRGWRSARRRTRCT